MFLIMGVSLYTSRIVLNTLGIEDFGIYNAVAGFVTMLSFLNNAMASATQRFLAFELGKEDKTKLHNVFNMSINIHLLISFVIFILGETIGLWFLKTQLTIPVDRMEAAAWVYHFSLAMLIIEMISVPYKAIIIAHERMDIFAWISIAEVSLKLFVVFVLQMFGLDKLKFYAVLLFGVIFLIKFLTGVYCHIKYEESKFRFYWNSSLFKILFSYAGWNLWGNSAGVIMGQGINVLLNIFFGPVVNAAYGIAFRVKNAVNQFVQNFQIALNPPIVKSFAANNLKYMHQLIFRGAKYSFFLLFSLSLPILFETEIILKIWLKTLPVYSVIFTKLVVVNILIESISRPLMTAAQASGKIRLYQTAVGSLLLFNLPVSYLFLKLGFAPESSLWIGIVISIIALFVRLKIISPLVKLNVMKFFKEVLLRIIFVSIISIIIPCFTNIYLQSGFFRLFISIVVALFSVGLAVYFVGLDKTEQIFVNKKLKLIFFKIKGQ